MPELEPEPEPEPQQAADGARLARRSQLRAADSVGGLGAVCREKGLMSLFELGRPVTICAPMVRYSKLPFRQVVRQWGCDIAYTPMIMADSFAASPEARWNEFSTAADDRPLIAQFGTNNAQSLAKSAAMIREHVDGVDINMGCPQRWAMQEGCGAALLQEVETVKDMVRLVKATVDLPCSAKIRIVTVDGRRDGTPDMGKTVDLVRALEAVGVSFITVHGRTCRQKSSEPVDYAAVKLVKESVQCPVNANGDIFSRADHERVVAETGVDGTMSARGLLANPALFHPAGFKKTPLDAAAQYLDAAHRVGPPTTFNILHHHLSYMLNDHLSPPDRKEFHECMSTAGLHDFLRLRGFPFVAAR